MISWVQEIQPRLRHLWRGAWQPGTVEPARYLYDHELVLVQKGACLVEIDGHEFHLRKGGWIIVPPGRVHTSTAGAPGAFRACIHFDWVHSKKPPVAAICAFHPKRAHKRDLTLAPAFVPKEVLSGSFAPEGPIPALVEEIFRHWETANAFSLNLARAHFLELLSQLLLLPAPASSAGASQALQIAYAAKEMLEQPHRPEEGIQAQLAQLGFSYAHVCRIFRKTFGIAPVAYRNAIRLERAKVLLRNPFKTVAEVAYEAGFDEPAYFTRLYRRQNGVPPSDRRR